MESKANLTKLIEKQIVIEKQVSEGVEKQLEMVHDAASKLLLTEMKYDAQKHASILQGILGVITDSDLKLWDKRIHSYVDKQVVKRELEKHIEIEQETLDLAKEQIKQTNDEGVKLLLQHIADDEERHHNLLKTIVKNSYKIVPNASES